MNKKGYTKKQLKKQLTTLTEEKSARSETALKKDLKNSFDALKKLDQVTTGQKIGDVTITKAMNKKIKNAKRYIEDLYDNITDGEIEEKEQNEEHEVTERNEKSEGHGKMFNALSGIKEGKVIKMSESTLKSVVERVIKEQEQITNKKPITEENVKITQATMERYMDVKFRELKDQNFVHLQRLTGLIEDNGCNK
jgi:hypothetical protein|tara:strand:- start:47 stop:631 length:585 start_codon:yes stop_codon:yes gene_type:complete